MEEKSRLAAGSALFVFSFPHGIVVVDLLLVVGNVITLSFPLFVAAAIDVIFILRNGPVTRHCFVLHIVLTSTSFHMIYFMCNVKNSYHFSRFA